MAIDREKIIASIKEVPCDTKVKAWVFTVDKKTYQLVNYFMPRIGDQVAIYDSNKKGVRTSQTPHIAKNGKDHMGLVNLFLDKLELEAIDAEA